MKSRKTGGIKKIKRLLVIGTLLVTLQFSQIVYATESVTGAPETSASNEVVGTNAATNESATTEEPTTLQDSVTEEITTEDTTTEEVTTEELITEETTTEAETEEDGNTLENAFTLFSSLLFQRAALQSLAVPAATETKLAVEIKKADVANSRDKGNNIIVTATVIRNDGTPVKGATINVSLNGSKYSRSNSTTGEINISFSGNPIGKNTILIEYKGGTLSGVTYQAAPSIEQEINIIDQTAPTGLSTTATYNGAPKGKILGVNAKQEYVVGNQVNNTSSRINIDGTEITGLSAGDYALRYKSYQDGNNYYLASDYTYITVPVAKYTVTPVEKKGIIWDSLTPVDVVQNGEATFHIAPENGVTIKAVTKSVTSGATLTYESTTGIIHVTGITRNLSINVEIVEPVVVPIEKPVEPIVKKNAKIALEINFIKDTRTISDDINAVIAEYVVTLKDDSGAPIIGAKINFDGVTSRGSRETNEQGVATLRGSYPEGTYLIKASYAGGIIGSSDYPALESSQEIKVIQQKKTYIDDRDVFAAKSGTTNGRVTNVDERFEYIEWIESVGVGQQLIPVTGTEVTGLKPTIYSFRLKEYAEGNTLYLSSPWYIFSLPRAEWTVTLKSDLTGINADQYTAIDVAPGGTAYFKISPKEGYKIAEYFVNKKDGAKSVTYDEASNLLTITGITRDLELSVIAKSILVAENPPSIITNTPNTTTEAASQTVEENEVSAGTGIVKKPVTLVPSAVAAAAQPIAQSAPPALHTKPGVLQVKDAEIKQEEPTSIVEDQVAKSATIQGTNDKETKVIPEEKTALAPTTGNPAIIIWILVLLAVVLGIGIFAIIQKRRKPTV